VPVSDRTWTVSGLIRAVNELLEQAFAGVRVEGEVTNLKPSARGHLYFTLKDDSASLDCVMWASRAGRLRFELEDGLAVMCTGSLTVYPQRGRFQLVVDELEPLGLGALQLAFEQLKRRLDAEGLFAAERKRPLPGLPNRVGIVTSLSGAALHDMLRVLRRFPHLEVIVAPAAVQGSGAAAEIAAALRRLATSGLVDVVIVGRGGGSLEDLWAFNEEPVARAIAASPVPVISGVGHEIDFTIADFVADLRATTPTQAAEFVVAQLERQLRRLDEAQSALRRDLNRQLVLARTRLAGLTGSSGLARVPHRVRLLRSRLDRAERLRVVFGRLKERALARLDRAAGVLRQLPALIAAGGHRRVVASRRQQLVQLARARVGRARAALDAHQRALHHLGPRMVLERGYSITTVAGDPRPLREASAVAPGAELQTLLARGELRSIVARRSPRVVDPAKAQEGDRQPSLFGDEGGG
jgi:exodeoxyribonuclease VII large subunit